jgi:rSAM/selenodomain-associated transferase 2
MAHLEPCRVSVVIPTLDEAATLGALVASLRREPELAEIILADGGSTDGTPELAARLGAQVVATERGRGHQLRAGAAVARGEVLLFLHADSVFPDGGLRAIVTALTDPRVVGGNFRLIFDGGSRFARGLTRFYALIRWVKLYYGDSGIFVRRSVYERIGGIKPMPLMEDYEFVRRMERAGQTRRITEPPLVTSSRKFTHRRATAIVAGWVVIHVLYWLGVSPARLARLYYPKGWRSHTHTSLRAKRSNPD